MEKAKPQKQHEWLQKFVGEWTYEAKDLISSGKPAETQRGAEKVRSVGDLWVVFEGRAEMPGAGASSSVMTLGFDPAKNRFVGTWFGDMMTHLWVYDGSLDSAQKVLTLESEGPSFSGDGTMGKYRDIIEVVDNDHRVLWGEVFGDGKWTRFMKTDYRRRK